MAELVLNQNSIYKNSQANFILNKEAVYTFTRSISSINDSVYGMQPTRDQLLSGFTLSDIFAINPLSTNGSLCANVYVLESNIDAMKFFASRPFVVCESIADRDAKAQNPVAVYLTPIFKEEKAEEELSVYRYIRFPEDESSWTYVSKKNIEEWDTLPPEEQMHNPVWSDPNFEMFSSVISVVVEEVKTLDNYEWIYVLSSYGWDEVREVYEKWEEDPENFKLTSEPGKWELVGSTSLTDEKISALFEDVNDTINAAVYSLNQKISEEKDRAISAETDLSNAISNISGNIEADIDSKINAVADDLSTNYETKDAAVLKLQEAKEYTDQKIEEETSARIEDYGNLLSSIRDEVSARQSANEKIETKIEDLVKNLSNEISAREEDCQSIRNEFVNYSKLSDLNNYVELSVLDSYAKLSDVSDLQDYLTYQLSNNINPRIDEIADLISAEVKTVNGLSTSLSDYAKLSDIPEIPDLNEYVKKSDISAVVESTLSNYEDYANGTDIPDSISTLIDWNKALHIAIRSLF